MTFNGTTVPSHRDDTYDTSEVHRKDLGELYESAFNDDQRMALDNISPGGGGGGAEPLIVNKVNTGTDLDPVMTLDHTFQEIFDAFMLGKAVLITEGEYDTELVYRTSGGELGYSLYTKNFTYSSNELDGYPVEN